MMRRSTGRLAVFLILSWLLLGTISAQEADQHSANPNNENGAASSESAPEGANAGIGAILAKSTEQGAHTAEKWGRTLGLGPASSFALSIALNFGGLALFFYILLKSKLPQAFRERTASIQKSIKDAEAASAEASRRLSDIESRLSKLDSEVADIRSSAEREAAAEEQRLRQAAEEDKRKVVQAAESEIDAIARNARRELKGYAASLAVDLAARQIRVDDSADHALVRDFVEHLGKDGK
jgi:F-type H+-transporting ATPase subunit b